MRTFWRSLVACLPFLLLFPAQAGLVGHWKFDEPSGSTLHDVTGRYDGQLSPNGATLAPGGIAGNALQLDRSQDGYALMHSFPGLVASNFTVSAWARLTPGDITSDTFLVTLHEAWYHNGFLVMLNQSGGLGSPEKASFYVSNERQTGSSTTSINDGAWHQIALVYDVTGTTRLYVDGGEAEAAIASTPTIERSPPLLVGGVYGQQAVETPRGFFTGWVDEVQLYDQALTTEEVNQLFSNPGLNLQDLNQAILLQPHGGPFVGSVEIRLTSTLPGPAIRYTLDGTEPGATSSLYSAPITLRDSATLKTRLFLDEFPVSTVVSATFTEVPPITFQPPGGLFTNSTLVSLIDNVGFGSIRYTADGTDPTPTSPTYFGPITLTNSATIRARLHINGFPVYEVLSANFQRVYALDDGVPNSWRERHFGAGYLTDPRVGAASDPDGDGWNNLLEFQADSNPLDPTSAPQIIVGIQAIPRVHWNTVPGLTYRVLRKPHLNAPTWTPILESFTATETNSVYIDAEAPMTAIYLIERLP